VAFLVVGITTAIDSDMKVRGQAASVASFEAQIITEDYEAVVSPTREVPRVSRLAELRAKVAGFVMPPAPVVVETPEVVLVTESPVVASTVKLCGNYQPINPAWYPTGLKFEVVEGARLVYRATDKVFVDEFGIEATVPDQEVIVQLPLRSAPQLSKSCIPTDVVGIALDGSLIRNHEHTLYRVFGEGTLIGYALDGFPIYGISTRKTDECGGVTMAAGYGYVLSAEREGVLGCFSGAPISL